MMNSDTDADMCDSEMSKLMKGRWFQVWEYHVSHGSLLIRSPAGPGIEGSIDIVCFGVAYFEAPRNLDEISISRATLTEIGELENILGYSLPPLQGWVLQRSGYRFRLVASHVNVRRHHGDILDSPFLWNWGSRHASKPDVEPEGL